MSNPEQGDYIPNEAAVDERTAKATQESKQPFNDELISDPNIRGFKVLSNNPDIIVRVSYIQEEHESATNTLSDKKVELYKQMKTLLEELASYGVAIPPWQYTVGHNNETGKFKHKLMMYQFVKRVYGTRLEDKIDAHQGASEEEVVALKSLFSSLIKYFRNKFTHGGKYLYDIINPEQYVIGHLKDDPTIRAYLIDVGPSGALVYDKDNWRESNRALIDELNNLARVLRHVEYLSDQEYEVVRREMIDFLDLIAESDKDYDIGQKIGRLKSHVNSELSD